MITSRAISTISYNSISFLTKVLNKLLNENTISFYCWIQHLPEEDDEKQHIHLFMVPNKRVDTDKLNKDFFREPVPKQVGQDEEPLPLNCVFWKTSNFTDWYLYGLHDKRYLVSKGLERKYYYTKENMVYSSKEYFNELVNTMDLSKYNGLDRFLTFIGNGGTFGQACKQGLVPIRLINQYEKFYDIVMHPVFKPSSYEKLCDYNSDTCVGGSEGGTFSTRGTRHVD